MPHLQIDYSANLEDRLDIAALCRALRDAGAATGILPLPGIRVRATACTHWVIADGDPAHGFLDIAVRMRAGRSEAEKAAVVQALWGAAEAHCAAALAQTSLALSLELREIGPEFSPKVSSVRRQMGMT